MFEPRMPLAGRVRLGLPPGQGNNTKSPEKIDYFDFTLAVRDGKYYQPDDVMNSKFGDKPKRIGPFFLISDTLAESVQVALAWWGGGAKTSRRKCFKLLDMLGGGQLGSAPASRLEGPRGKEKYVDYPCLGMECDDFKKPRTCGKGTLYRFLAPEATRLGKYELSHGSWAAARAAFGFIEILKRILPFDPETGRIIGLSKVPVFFEVHQTTTRHNGKDIPVFFPVPVIEDDGGAFIALQRIGQSASRALGAGSTASHRAQLRSANESMIEEDVETISYIDVVDDSSDIEQEAAAARSVPAEEPKKLAEKDLDNTEKEVYKGTEDDAKQEIAEKAFEAEREAIAVEAVEVPEAPLLKQKAPASSPGKRTFFLYSKAGDNGYENNVKEGTSEKIEEHGYIAIPGSTNVFTLTKDGNLFIAIVEDESTDPTESADALAGLFKKSKHSAKKLANFIKLKGYSYAFKRFNAG